ncbi:peptidoglycan DD-metalloendopeptidase family protein [Propionicicella superfundia]|uniref:peptidoglycan DD-metalloendopeptidase family protein n=1 Tax=Propionicicella superfundia TaxID=348582 RepID=UPI0003FDB287|nr:peptidoglycan DD-metalloendopeptidase family protein [Propionicicella superfundia]
MRRLSIVLLACVLSFAAAAPAAALPTLPDPATAPVDGDVVRGFDPPELDWLPGHRGVDLAVAPGAVVRAAASGTVTFAGSIAGRGVIVVSHGSVRTTYEPVAPTTAVGQRVTVGSPLGSVQAGHAGCPAEACLHWGLREGEEYLDPLLMLTAQVSEVRLLPAGSRELTAGRIRERATGPAVSPRTGAALLSPVTGPVTSPFGMRVDPITGTWRLHSGTDFGAPCGSPIRAAAAGVVRSVAWHPSYGNRLVLEHGQTGGSRLTTAYNHATGYIVEPGRRVAAGQVIGSVGTTGDSTGCHLHFMVYADDRLADPMEYLTRQ